MLTACEIGLYIFLPFIHWVFVLSLISSYILMFSVCRTPKDVELLAYIWSNDMSNSQSSTKLTQNNDETQKDEKYIFKI